MAAAATLLYCLGATKAGTSWLHRYLSDHPETRMPTIKELHYWDSVATGKWDFWVRDTAKKYQEHLDKAETDNPKKRARQLRMSSDTLAWLEVIEKKTRDDAAYVSFLNRRVKRCERLVGDLTPAYGLLSQDWLRQMAAVGPDVRFVYILRDPVARLWSHCRMIARRRAETDDEIPWRANNILKRTIEDKEPEIAERSEYAGALERMRAAIAPGRLHLMFYEEMFAQPAMDGLCDFLGLSRQPGDFCHVVMPSPAAEMTDDRARAARDWLAPQYDYAERTFDRLPDAWGVQRVEV